MLWVLRRESDGSFEDPKHVLKLMGNFTLKNFVYLNQWVLSEQTDLGLFESQKIKVK